MLDEPQVAVQSPLLQAKHGGAEARDGGGGGVRLMWLTLLFWKCTKHDFFLIMLLRFVVSFGYVSF